MAIEIRERFRVEAPIDVVWPFVKDPTQLVTCMPGASLDEVVDDRTFIGTVKVKLGAVTAKYKGRVEYSEIDEEAHVVRVLAQGREASGGTAKGTLSSQVVAISGDCTEIIAEGGVDLTGRVVQMGRGMIQGVSEQLFEQFAESTKRRLEAAALLDAGVESGTDGAAGATAAAAGQAHGPEEAEAIRAFQLLWKVFKSWMRKLWRRLIGRPAGKSSVGVSEDPDSEGPEIPEVSSSSER